MENAAEFFDSIKSPDAYKATLRQVIEAIKKDPNTYIEELKIDGDKLQRRSIIAGQTSRDVKDVPFNTDIDDKIDDGRPGKIKFVKDGDNKIIRTQIVDGQTITSTFEVKGDVLTLKQTNGSVSTTQVYKKLS